MLFDQNEHLNMDNVFSFWGSYNSILVKNLQFSQCMQQIPLPQIPNSKFCPGCTFKLSLLHHYPATPAPCSAILFWQE